MRKHRPVLCTVISALVCQPALATDISFSGGASGTDPLGHSYSLTPSSTGGTTFRLGTSTPLGGFNPSGNPIGGGSGVVGLSIALTGPRAFDPTPVNVPDACPPGQTAIYISIVPLVITCLSLITGGTFTRYTWQYSMRSPGVVSFDAPADGVLRTATTGFDFTIDFPTPVDPNSFGFTATWTNVAAIPEPMTSTLFLLGLAGLGLGAARRRNH